MDELPPRRVPALPLGGLRAAAKHMQPTSPAPSSAPARPPPANTDNTYLALWASGGDGKGKGGRERSAIAEEEPSVVVDCRGNGEV